MRVNIHRFATQEANERLPSFLGEIDGDRKMRLSFLVVSTGQGG